MQNAASAHVAIICKHRVLVLLRDLGALRPARHHRAQQPVPLQALNGEPERQRLHKSKVALRAWTAEESG
jgi:hypothetical protein